MKVSVAEAKNKLPELIKAVENGEHVTICRRGYPVVDMIRTVTAGPQKPKFGTVKLTVHDPEWWKPMTDREIDSLLSDL